MAAQEKMPDVVEMTQEEMDALVDRLDHNSLTQEDRVLLKGVLRSVVWLRQTVMAGKITIHKLKGLFRGFRSEKRSANRAKGKENDEDSDDSPGAPRNEPAPCEKGSSSATPFSDKSPIQGHGRRGAASYFPSETIEIPHARLRAGDPCPEDCGGRLYDIPPGIFVQIQGQPLVKTVQYSLKKLRCALCGSTVSADLPASLKKDWGRHDFRFKALLVCQKYFVGVPFYRQEAFQNMLNVTLPDSTQWDLIAQVADVLDPLLPALEKAAAGANVIYGDDTGVKILDVKAATALDPTVHRKGTYTSAFYAEADSFSVALYYSSRRHAGENFVKLLKERPPDLPKLIHMSDALAANIQKEVEEFIHKAFCLAHARRYFEDLLFFYPQECTHYMDEIGKVYKNDEATKEKGLSPEERLAYHQHHSGPVMEALREWLDARSLGVEPNSALAKAIRYSLRHWAGLTLFLRQAGAPLDNNVCEQLIKLPVRLRKNSLFHRTERGARIAGLMMSVIQTCDKNKINPVEYLVACQRHSSDLARDPEAWLPWVYQETLERKMPKTQDPSSLMAA